jgi:hypothetical protein
MIDINQQTISGLLFTSSSIPHMIGVEQEVFALPWLFSTAEAKPAEKKIAAATMNRNNCERFLILCI